MSSNLMSENDAIRSHLTNVLQQENITYFSAFVAALRDSRKFTKRSQDTGQKRIDDNCGDHGSWLGAIGYLSLLDQIGKCFKPRTAPIINGNSISKALKYFTNLSDLEVDAVYALRNAFAHDYSLFNINNNHPTYTHHYTVIQSPTQPFVRLPQNQWDGNHLNRTNSNLTIINLEALGDTVEQICAQLFQLSSNNELEVTLQGGSDELVRRYSFYAAG